MPVRFGDPDPEFIFGRALRRAYLLDWRRRQAEARNAEAWANFDRQNRIAQAKFDRQNHPDPPRDDPAPFIVQYIGPDYTRPIAPRPWLDPDPPGLPWGWDGWGPDRPACYDVSVDQIITAYSDRSRRTT